MAGQIGQVLREAREARGLTLDEVERATKIRPRYLAAIEDDDWDVLPGRAYASGFVRTYAEFVDVDSAPLVAQLHRELDPGTREEESPPEPIVQPGTLPTGLRRRVTLRAVAVALVAAAAVVLVVLAIAGGEEGPDEVAAPPPAQEEPSTEPEPAEEEPPAPEPDDASVAIEATGSVWVCLVDGRDEPLVDGETLAEGESRGPFEARRLRMTFGNGQLEMTAGGEPFDVPDAAEPLGFEVTAEGVEDLDPTEHPTCA